MHELAVTQSILSIVLEKAQEAKAKKITQIDLLVGRLTGYVPECIQLQFDILSQNTPASGASLAFYQPAAKLHCRKCNRDYTSESFDLICPQCHALEIDILSGSELYVESIEVE
ncbi:MAG: hydrogenase maturation nickel metallochaperone HypA [Candidatus Omnitrophica bacterium]|nr:hydrogenase maturation nickel metallochaperone HypA [Candidatus Omnitrophota bacterium]